MLITPITPIVKWLQPHSIIIKQKKNTYIHTYIYENKQQIFIQK